MQLPFTREQCLEVFGAYNTMVFPAVVLLWLATARGDQGPGAVGGPNHVVSASTSPTWV